MAYDSEPEKEQLRKEAERDTQKALEREERQKKEREEQHKETLRRKLRTVQDLLSSKKRELGAIELESDSLEHIIRAARISPMRAGTSTSRQAETKVHELIAQLDEVRSRVRAATSEVEEHKRASEVSSREAARGTEGTLVVQLEREVERGKSEEQTLSQRLVELARLLTGQSRKSSYAPPDLEVAAEERITRDLRTKLAGSLAELEHVSGLLRDAREHLEDDKSAEGRTRTKVGPDDGSSREIERSLREKQASLEKVRRELTTEKAELAALEKKIAEHETLLASLTRDLDGMKHQLTVKKSAVVRGDPSFAHKIDAEEQDVKTNTEKIERLERTVNETKMELEKHKRLLEIRKRDVESKITAHENDTKVLEEERDAKLLAQKTLQAQIAEGERKLREAKRKTEQAGVKKGEATEEEREAKKSEQNLNELRRQEKSLTAELAEHKVELDTSTRNEKEEEQHMREVETKASSALARKQDHERRTRTLAQEIRDLEGQERELEGEIR